MVFVAIVCEIYTKLNGRIITLMIHWITEGSDLQHTCYKEAITSTIYKREEKRIFGIIQISHVDYYIEARDQRFGSLKPCNNTQL